MPPAALAQRVELIVSSITLLVSMPAVLLLFRELGLLSPSAHALGGTVKRDGKVIPMDADRNGMFPLESAVQVITEISWGFSSASLKFSRVLIGNSFQSGRLGD